MAENQSKYAELLSTHTGSNYLSLFKSSGEDYVVNFFVNAQINNENISEFLPPQADGPQYEVDRQSQLRGYAQTISHYTLGLYVKKDDVIYRRKSIPLYKYFPDHQVDIYPMLFDSTQGMLGENEEILLKFEGDTLPTVEDDIVAAIHYFTVKTISNEAWFTLNITANQESVWQLPDNTYNYTFKQQNGVNQLKWSYQPGVINATEGYDLLEPEFEENSDNNANNKIIYFTCDTDTTVLAKAWSE